jgi:hypothetical protein
MEVFMSEADTKPKAKPRAFILIAVITLAVVGIVPFILMSSSVGDSPEFACVMEQVERNPTVIRAVGEPIETGSTRLSYSERNGSRYEAGFTVSISGPRGDGRIRSEVYRAPVESYLLVEYESVEGWTTIYEGDYPCRQ